MSQYVTMIFFFCDESAWPSKPNISKHCFFASTLAPTTHLGFQFNMAASSSSKQPAPSEGRKSDARKAAAKQMAKAKAKSCRSGKSNWANFNQDRKAMHTAKQRTKQGLPVVRLRIKQTVRLPVKGKGRMMQHATRIEDEDSQEKKTVGVQTEYQCTPHQSVGVQTEYQCTPHQSVGVQTEYQCTPYQCIGAASAASPSNVLPTSSFDKCC